MIMYNTHIQYKIYLTGPWFSSCCSPSGTPSPSIPGDIPGPGTAYPLLTGPHPV